MATLGSDIPSRRKGGVLVAQQLNRRSVPTPPPRLPAPNINTRSAGEVFAASGPAPGVPSVPNINVGADNIGVPPSPIPQIGDALVDAKNRLPGVDPNINTRVPPPTTAPNVPSALPPPPGNPFEGFDPNSLAAAFGSGSDPGGSGRFTPQGGDTGINPELEQILAARARGETGGPSFDDIVSGVFDPMSRLIDTEFKQAQDQAVEQMISRGVLDSSEAGRTLGDLAIQMSNNKAALLGQLGLDFQRQREQSIQNALSTLGILEGNKLQARTSITTANIGAAAQVQSASLQAGATRQAALISSQARLQEAGLNARVALQRLQAENDRSLVEQGIDPVAFQNDPDYRGSVFQYFEYQRHQEELLMDYIIEQERQKAQGAGVSGGA